MFVFALLKKLAQNMGISNSGSGKTAKSKTCNMIYDTTVIGQSVNCVIDHNKIYKICTCFEEGL